MSLDLSVFIGISLKGCLPLCIKHRDRYDTTSKKPNSTDAGETCRVRTSPTRSMKREISRELAWLDHSPRARLPKETHRHGLSQYLAEREDLVDSTSHFEGLDFGRTKSMRSALCISDSESEKTGTSFTAGKIGMNVTSPRLISQEWPIGTAARIESYGHLHDS